MTQSKQKITILIIEDDPALRHSLQEFLKQSGFIVETASDVSQALLKLWTGSYDIALTDIVMPGLSGLKLLDLSKNILDVVDFIVITGNDSPENRVEAARLGAKGYFVKPFPVQELLALIEKIQQTRKEK
ncbi:response regulator [bacterium]|nr:response regulator [bacterium]